MATVKRVVSVFGAALGIYLCAGWLASAQEPVKVDPHIHVAVDLVQLNVAVTDGKGNYITGLKPGDFTVLEDGIQQKVATFGEGNEPTRKLEESEKGDAKYAAGSVESVAQSQGDGKHISGAEMGSMVAGANVFVLFDTSNYMYRGFVYAQDAISDFIRSLDA